MQRSSVESWKEEKMCGKTADEYRKRGRDGEGRKARGKAEKDGDSKQRESFGGERKTQKGRERGGGGRKVTI